MGTEKPGDLLGCGQYDIGGRQVPMLMCKVMAGGSNLTYVGIKVPPILNIASSIS